MMRHIMSIWRLVTCIMEKLSVQCMWILYRRVLCNHPYLFWLFAVLLCLHHVTLLFDALYEKGKVHNHSSIFWAL